MNYNNESRLSKSSENKKRIISSAIKLINEKGFDNVSVEEITSDAKVSKGAFYIHFKSKEDLIIKEINFSYDGLKLDDSYSKKERLIYFISKSIDYITSTGLKMVQKWFSFSVLGNNFGKAKLDYDLKYIESLTSKEDAKKIVSIYYGALNLWCFTSGEINPKDIVMNYLNDYKEV